MGSISGTFIDQDTITVNGNPGTQQSEVHCTHLDAQRVTLRSEWSQPKDIAPTTGTPVVTITGSKTTCLQGEAVVLEALATGFQCLRPVHDLH